RRCFIAACCQNDAVERITVEHFDQPEIGKVAIQGSGRTLAGLLERMNRKFERNPDAITNTGLHAFRQYNVMPIARNEIVSSLGNSDDRTSRLQFLPREAVVEKTLEVESGHIGVVRVVPP